MIDEPRLTWSPLLGSAEFPPLSALVEVEFGAATNRGRRRVHNSDHYLVVRLGRSQQTIQTSLPPDLMPLPFEESGYGMVVADGGGEAGSRLALTTLVHVALHFGKWNLRIDHEIAREVMGRLDRFYRSVDGVVSDERSAEPATAGLETTMTLLCTAGQDCFVAHVGHSRAYLLRDRRLLKLTRDHTVEGAPETAPILTAVASDLHHILTHCIGHDAGHAHKVQIDHFRLSDNDLLMLCTNGLTDVLPDPRIEVLLLGDALPAELSRTLVDHALEAGTQDDVTVVLARYRIPT